MGGRVVEGTGLENRQARKRLEGSNPSPSAIPKRLFASQRGTAMPQLRWQKRVFEDVLKERRYQERQWGDVDDTLNTPWMWCAYICSYATKWMQNPHRWTREDTEEFYDRMIQTSAIAAAAAESVLRQREAHGKTFYEGAAPPEQ
jgi:hypothetical protein